MLIYIYKTLILVIGVKSAWLIAIANCMSKSYVYWTVHHLHSWIKRDQRDVTCFIISFFNAQHVSDVNTSILRSLRLTCWVISWVVLLWFDVCWCYVVVWLWWCGIRMQAEALVPQPAYGFLRGRVTRPSAQPHTWRTRFSFLVRPVIFGLSGKGGPTRSVGSRRLRPERDVGLEEREGRCVVGTGQRPKPWFILGINWTNNQCVCPPLQLIASSC